MHKREKLYFRLLGFLMVVFCIYYYLIRPMLSVVKPDPKAEILREKLKIPPLGSDLVRDKDSPWFWRYSKKDTGRVTHLWKRIDPNETSNLIYQEADAYENRISDQKKWILLIESKGIGDSVSKRTGTLNLFKDGLIDTQLPLNEFELDSVFSAWALKKLTKAHFK